MTIVGRVPADLASPAGEHLVSVVIPTYRPRPAAARRSSPRSRRSPRSTVSPEGWPFRVAEVLLVHDCGPDDPAQPAARAGADATRSSGSVWLSRNFGQHAATLAGMASSGGDWIVTLDEDGQHDPVVHRRHARRRPRRAGERRLRQAGQRGAARRRCATRPRAGAKRLVTALSGGADASVFHSYRLILGEVGRSVAAYAGAGVYLDIALGWVAGRVDDGAGRAARRGGGPRPPATRCAACSRTSGGWCSPAAPAGCGWSACSGWCSPCSGLLLAVFMVIRQLVHPAPTEGWTSLIVVILICTGAILFSLG